MTAREIPDRKTFGELCALACRRSIALRGLKFALVVGPILIAINHWEVIASGQLGPSIYLKMGLTFMVPYMVSVFSSVGAVLARNEGQA